jgi:hypothetical protein
MKIPSHATLAVILLMGPLAACGSGTQGPQSPAGREDAQGKESGGGEEEAEGDGPAAELAEHVEKLNEAIEQGDEAAAEALLEEQTAEMMVEAVSLLPEAEPLGDEYTLADYLAWEKEQGVVYVLDDVDAEGGTGTLVGQVDGLDEFEGTVTLVEEDGETRMEFLDLAALRRDDILSEGLQRQKYIDIIDAINTAIEDMDSNVLQNKLTLDTLNEEIELLSYSTKKKSALSLKGVVRNMHNKGYVFTVEDLDVDTGDTTLTILDEDGDVVIEGPAEFKAEMGQMRLHYAPLLEARIEELEAKKAK